MQNRHMKRVLILFFAIITVMAANAQNAGTPKDRLEVKELKYDFGKIPQGKPVTHEFEIVNNGNEPLHIENVQAACGCTTPEWTRDPIPAGGTKKIKVGYNAVAFGKFEKAVTIYYDAGKTKQFYIRGEVWQAPADIAPSNASIQLLKNTNW